MAAWYHDLRSVMKDSLPTDDQVFPLIYTTNTDDHYCRLGEIEDRSHYHLFRLGTGSGVDQRLTGRQSASYSSAPSACAMGAIGRWTSAVEAFTYPENWVSPVLNRRYALDPVQFKPVLDAYYRQFGWDPTTGWPTPERLQALGLGDVYDEMASGAERANQRGNVWPDEPAIDSTVVERPMAPAQAMNRSARAAQGPLGRGGGDGSVGSQPGGGCGGVERLCHGQPGPAARGGRGRAPTAHTGADDHAHGDADA